ncbi:hypothetical protein TNCV_4178011 [Trichonephila clavipes]|nr:hypothetical protein TNCV_4178011 [Trichonephila clavipes]
MLDASPCRDREQKCWKIIHTYPRRATEVRGGGGRTQMGDFDSESWRRMCKRPAPGDYRLFLDVLRRNHQMAQIVRHNDESIRGRYIRNGGKEVKLVRRPRTCELHDLSNHHERIKRLYGTFAVKI